MKLFKGIGTVLVAAALAGSGVGVAAAESSTALDCALRADRPNAANDAIMGRVGCSNTISGEGVIKESRFGFDDIVGRKTFPAGTEKVLGSCGNGEGSYYSVFTSSSGARAGSSIVTTCR